MEKEPFVSRAGQKLAHGLKEFCVEVRDLVVADFGCSTGGFTDCLLQNGAAKVYAVDTAYGELAYKLRIDPRVVVLERNNAMHVQLPEKVDIITVDTSWTRQGKVMPNVITQIKDGGQVISLVKPHYEATRAELFKGVAKPESIPDILDRVEKYFMSIGLQVLARTKSPIEGKRGGNEEWVYLLELVSRN
ncbi:MAG: SAM-dependent methyltransferase [Candidatus Dojkabacteria bacterium]